MEYTEASNRIAAHHWREDGSPNTSITTWLVRKIKVPQNRFQIDNPPGRCGAMKRKGKFVDTPGRRFLNEQIVLLQRAKTNELIEKHYHDDAVLISTSGAVRGQAALKKHFRAYVTMLVKIEVLSLDSFIETHDSILLEATIRTALGETKVYDAFVLRNGKVTHHFTGVL